MTETEIKELDEALLKQSLQDATRMFKQLNAFEKSAAKRRSVGWAIWAFGVVCCVVCVKYGYPSGPALLMLGFGAAWALS